LRPWYRDLGKELLDWLGEIATAIAPKLSRLVMVGIIVYIMLFQEGGLTQAPAAHPDRMDLMMFTLQVCILTLLIWGYDRKGGE
jgi:hypothetical protein